ncbi:MAG: hypothetical protein J6S14_08935 [Clostridia bacterium]|nr:hypothetical protein [Clostridia bacterium]
MIKIIKGTYGRETKNGVEAMTKNSEPFELSASREAELIAAGVAVKVEEEARPKSRRKATKTPEKLYDDDKRESGLLIEE